MQDSDAPAAQQVDRRSALKAGAVVAGTLAYAVPALTVLNMGVAEAASAPGKMPSKEKPGKAPSPEKPGSGK